MNAHVDTFRAVFHRAALNAPIDGISRALETTGAAHVGDCIAEIERHGLLASYTNDDDFAGFCKAKDQARRMREGA